MINLLKKYYRYIFVFIGVSFVFIVTYVTFKDHNYDVNRIEKLSDNKNISVKKESKKTVFVDVKGAVNSPGVYELDSNKRVIDAINTAGGLNKYADTINLNLSSKIKDEMIIIVYTKTEIANYYKNNNSRKASCASLECVCNDEFNDACINNNSRSSSNISSKQESNKNLNNKISLNTATKEELMTLNSIGESKAEKIINYRQETGKFKSIEDIKNVPGIGDAIFEKIKNNITI